MRGNFFQQRALLLSCALSLCASLTYALADAALSNRLRSVPAPIVYGLFVLLALAIVACGLALRRELARDLGRELACREPRQAASALLRAFGLLAAFALALGVASVLFALLFQALLGSLVGRDGVAIAIAIFAQVLAVLAVPVMLALFLAPVLGLGRPKATDALAASKHLLLALLLLTAAFAGASHLLGAAIGLAPYGMRGALHFALNLIGGVAWLCCISAIVRQEATLGPRRSLLALPVVARAKGKLAGALSKGCACVLAFVLAFSLGGKVSFAHAAEVQEQLAERIEEQAELASSLADGVATEGAEKPEEAKAPEPADPKAAPPEDFYGFELDEVPGTPVATDGEAVVFQEDARHFTTVIGGRDLVYATEDGALAPIDNTLVAVPGKEAGNPTYVNAANSFSAELPAKMDEGRGLVLRADECSIGLVPLDGDFTVSAAEGTSIRYTEVAEGIDYQYTLVGSLVKEDVILKREVAPRTFRTRIDLPARLACALEEGSVVVRDAAGELVATIAAPDMEDAAGAVSDGVRLALDEEEGAPVIALDIDWEWASAPERAYPVRIDPSVSIGASKTTITVVESAWDRVIGDSGFLPVGYDDGVATASGAFNPGGRGHEFCRVYAKFDYDFAANMNEERIDSATFSLYQFTTLSAGKNNMGAYRMDEAWDYYTLKWNTQKNAKHTFLSFKKARTSEGYVKWDVREAVNAWAQGLAAPNGIVLKSEDERNMQCEVFSGNTSANPPKLEVKWSTPDPVSPSYPLNSTTVALRPVTETTVAGTQAVDGVFADGVATPGAAVGWQLDGRGDAGASIASKSYKYPDSSAWEAAYPNATKYKDKLGNWQTPLFANLSADALYSLRAQPVLNATVGKEVASDKFLIYQAKATDTLPYIAKHYGVSLSTICADNHVHDSLSIKGNTLFVRNPKTTAAYNPSNLSVDQKRRIDSALMGRAKHCEYGYEPVNLSTGNFVMERVDASVPEVEGDFKLARTYNSKAADVAGAFGRGWSFAWDASLSMTDANTIAYSAGDGKVYFFSRASGLTFRCPEEPALTLTGTRYTQNKVDYVRWTLSRQDGSYDSFDAWGLMTSRTSALGLATTIQRNAEGLVSAVVSPSGIRFGLEWDAAGHITKLALPGGAACTYGYDASGNLVSATEPNGATSRYGYDGAHRMTSFRDPDGNMAVRNAYDNQGRVISQTDALGGVVRFSYVGGATIATDAMGQVTTYRYDSLMRTVGIGYPDGTSVSRGYDASGNLAYDEEGIYAHDGRGNLTCSTSPDGWATSYSYDGKNRLVGQVNPDGEEISYAYSAAGDLVSQTSSSGEAFSFEYDSAHRLLRATDADGVSIAYAYSGPWVTSETDALGRTTAYAYDAMGRRVSVTDPAGNISRTMYDAAGNIVGETDGTGAHTTYELTPMGYLASLVDANGQRTAFIRDAKGQATSVTLPSGATESYAYDAAGNQVAHTDALGNVESWSYDCKGRCTAHADLAGNATSYAYDARGYLTSEEGPDGAITTYERDGTYGVALATIDALGNRTESTYDTMGRLTKSEDALGTIAERAYASGGRLISEADGAGATTSYAYTAAGRLAKVDVEGRIWELAYDEAGQMTSMVDPAGEEWAFAYDAAGNLASATDPEGNVTTYAYDGAGRQVSTTDPEGATISTEYDVRGNVIAQVDGAGVEVRYAYGSIGELLSVTDGAGNVTAFEYDAVGNLVKTTDARGFTTAFEYDALGRAVAAIDALGNRTEQGYDAAGNVARTVDARGNAASLAYDALGNLTSLTDVMGVTLSFAYDVRGNMTSASDGDARHWDFGYDGAGRQISKTDMLGRTVTSEYDEWGEVVRATDAAGAVTTYAYDACGLLVSTTDALGNASTRKHDKCGNLVLEQDAAGNRTAYQYDGCGRVVAAIDKAGAMSAYAYDDAGRIVAMTDGEGYRRTYGYDEAGNLTSETDPLGNETAYAYDGAGNLVRFALPSGRALSFDYDGVGNLIAWRDPSGAESSYAYDGAGNVTAAKDPLSHATAYAYDAAGNVTSMTDPIGATTTLEHDQVGNLIRVTDAVGATQTYAYDVADRLVGTTTPLGRELALSYDVMDNIVGIADNLGLENAFAYDALGRLTSATDSNGSERKWAYDAVGNVIAYRDGAGNATRIAYDGMGRPTSMTDGAGATARYAYDKRGNLVSATSGATVEAAFSYDAAGNLASKKVGKGVSTWRYDADGRVVAATDAFGTASAFGYDEAGRLMASVKAASADGAASALRSLQESGQAPEGAQSARYAYDAAGNLTSRSEGTSQPTTYSYDAAGRIASVTDGAGSTTYERDALGNVASATDALGATTSYAYDALGNLTSVTSPTGATERIARDAAGRPTSYVDGAGTETRFAYDGEGNLTSKSYPASPGSEVGYAYDDEGNLASRSDWTGTYMREYDGAGRIASETDGAGRRLAYSYDGDGRVSSVAYPDGKVARYSYDVAGNPASISTDAGSWNISCDAEGRPASVARPDGSSTSWQRDGLGRISAVENLDAHGDPVSSYAYAYDGAGRIAREQWQAEGLGEGSRELSYDDAGRLAGVAGTGPDGAFKESFAYDAAGNRVEASRTGAGAYHATFAYDADGRLVSSTSNEGKTTYAYDDAGNLTELEAPDGTTTYSYGLENRLTAVMQGDALSLGVAYDGDGNRVWQASVGEEAIAQGGVSASEGVADALPNLGDGLAPLALALCSGFAGSLGIANPAASGALLQLLASKWHARGRGRGRDELDADDLSDDATGGLGAGEPPVSSIAGELASGGVIVGMDERAYASTSLSDVAQPLATVGEDGATSDHLYLFDAGGDDLTALLDPVATEAQPELSLMSAVAEPSANSTAASVETRGLPQADSGSFSALPLAEGATSYAFDGRGSVTAAFDGSGSLVGTAAFSVTGTIEAATGTLPSRGWNAEEADSATGLVYLRARFLVTATLSFASQDTYLGQAANPASQLRYAYSEGDPVNAIDPSGHKMLTSYEAEYKAEAERRRQESIMAKYSPSSKERTYERRREYNESHQLTTTAQRMYNEQQLSKMQEGADRSYLAWSMYNNGWISRAAAEKYCSQYLHMGKEAPKPMAAAQCATALDALQKGASFTIEITKGANAVGWQAARVVVKSGTGFGESSLAAMNKILSGAGKVVGAIGVATGIGSVAVDTYAAYNNPNVTPDRAASDASVEFLADSWVFVGATAGGLMAASGAYILAGTLIGGPAGLIAMAVVGVAFGIGALMADKYLEDSGKKQQWKDNQYAANHSNGR